MTKGRGTAPSGEARTGGEIFDRAYYARYYENPRTRVTDAAQIGRLADFVCGYLGYLGVNVRRVLDLGCGIGLWREPLARHYPGARYHGVEYSEYLCEQYGWTRGSAVDFQSRVAFDLVVCQGVLPYLDTRDAGLALANLAALSRGALYLEAVTSEDFREGVVDEQRTDAGMHKRPRSFYLKALAKSFVNVGGGLFIHKDAGVPIYALERL